MSEVGDFHAWSSPEGDFPENVSTNHEHFGAVEIVGAQIDTIDSVYPSMISPPNDAMLGQRGWHGCMYEWLNRCLAKTKSMDEDNSHGELSRAFWRTLTLDVSATGRYPCTDQDFNVYITTLRCLWSALDGDHAPTITPEDFQSFQIWYHRHFTLWYHRAFTTTKGGRIGYTSTPVRPDDSICILYSGPTIYVLRPYPGKSSYQFISDGYIYGLMNGEGVEMIKSGQVHTQRFTLE